MCTSKKSESTKLCWLLGNVFLGGLLGFWGVDGYIGALPLPSSLTTLVGMGDRLTIGRN